ncbi:MAG: hypothetical protein GC185_04165 [Alphaproteobacteria bacterium]|nr:hypothetical protein [Alphaproteobacteria bacterium]
MDFDLSTFLLEMFNFLVLVWILKRFFYKPVRKAIDQRQQAIEKSIADAKGTQAQADALKAQYEARLTDWEDEKRDARHKLQEDMEAEKTRQMDALKKSLDAERQRSAVLDARKQEDAARESEVTALAQAATFAAELLKRVSGPGLNEKLAEAFVEDLKNMPADQKKSLQKVCAENKTAEALTAYALEKPQQEAVKKALADLAGHKIDCSFKVDEKVIAGLRVSIGSYALQASVKDELQFFARAAQAAMPQEDAA